MLLLFITPSSNGQTKKDDPNSGVMKYSTLIQYLKYAYVDTIDESKLVEKAIVETLKELDPHSAYISKKDVVKPMKTW